MERIPTRCKAFDELLDGGLATGTITQLFGEKALGKSIFSHQAACSVVAGGRSAVILDTEQSYSSYLLPYRQKGMDARFGKEIPVHDLRLERLPRQSGRKKGTTRGELLTAIGGTLDRLGVSYTDAHLGPIADILCPTFDVAIPSKEPSVFVLQTPQVTDLLNLHGVDASIEVSSGGRVELRQKAAPSYESALRTIIRDTGAKLLVYDSVSAPFKSAFFSTQDLPARSAGLAAILSHAQRLCIEFGIAVLAVSHVTISPIDEWDRRPYGGLILGHDAKFSFELTKATAMRRAKWNPTAVNPDDEPGDGPDGRAFWVLRHPAMADYSRYGFSRITEEGFT